ncbi:MAG: VWA domain-containing protein [Mariniblastus sp.]
MTQPSNSNSKPPGYLYQTGSESLGKRRLIPAWLLSLLLHTTLFVGLIFTMAQYQNGASEVENRTGGIVLVNATSESTEYLDEGDVEESSNPAMSAESPPPLAIDSELPPDLPGFESAPTQITGVGDSLLEALPGADSLIVSNNQSSGKIGGQVTTEVFGIKGTGSRFVYVFDRSKSMDGYGGRPMRAARQQLLASLDSLKDVNQFQIIFYNGSTDIFSPENQKKMHPATDKFKEDARKFINRTQPDGGTDHVNALKAAFKMNPDVIFFLTDAEGGFTQTELRILRNNNRSRAVINAIEFGDRKGSGRTLRDLAESSGGQYVFKNIRSLQTNGD